MAVTRVVKVDVVVTRAGHMVTVVILDVDGMDLDVVVDVVSINRAIVVDRDNVDHLVVKADRTTTDGISHHFSNEKIINLFFYKILQIEKVKKRIIETIF